MYNFSDLAPRASASSPVVRDRPVTFEVATTVGTLFIGELFHVLNSGSVFVGSTLHPFTNGGTDGKFPKPDLARDGAGKYYGSAPNGGAFNINGVIFQLTPNGEGTLRMPTEIKMRLDFVTAGDMRAFAESVTDEHELTDEHKENLARELFAESRKAISFEQLKIVLPDLVDFLLEPPVPDPLRPSGPMDIFDALNRQALWLEISNRFADLRFLLPQAKAYKDLEPMDSNPISDPLCADLHYQKMYMLNLAVFELVKIQDLVVRLLQESFGGQLIEVDYNDDEWGKRLTVKEARKGLNALVSRGELTKQDQLIVEALDIPAKSPFRDTGIDYRNRLTHAIRPSVDYPELYTEVQDRAGRAVKDSTGKETGRMYSLGGGQSKAEFLFVDFYAALSDYLGHVAEMLKALKLIPRLT